MNLTYLIDFMKFGIIFCSELIDCMRFLDFLDVVGILYKHVKYFQFHQIALLCDHQELACTSKDPPRRVDMKEMSLFSFIRTFLELSTKPFENLLSWTRLKTANAFSYLNSMNYMN